MKKIISIVFIILLLLPVSSNAEKYPSLFIDDGFYLTANKGDVVTLHFNYFPEYKNEKTHVEIYDSNGKLIASSVQERYNSGISDMIQKLNYTIDTKDWKTGEYTIKAYCDFYTLYEWHTVPSARNSYLTIVDPAGSTPTPNPTQKSTPKPTSTPTSSPTPEPTLKPTNTPSSEVKPEYKISEVSYNGKAVVGKLLHKVGTGNAEKLRVKVTFYIVGNYYMSTNGIIEEGGIFEVGGVGPIQYITVVAYDNTQNGEMNRFDVAELFVTE